MNTKISPSVMCADFFQFADYIKAFENNKIDLLHVDIMDGCFVPNFTLGTDFVRILKENTSIPLDLHLMIEKPEEKLQWFSFSENDCVSVHCESTCHLHKALYGIKEKGAKAFVALNPATNISVLDEVLSDIDGVLIMTVNPGFAGQKLIPSTLKKIQKTRSFLNENGFLNVEIEVDGNVSFENAELMRKAGANIFVAGTSSLFQKDVPLADAVKRFRETIQ